MATPSKKPVVDLRPEIQGLRAVAVLAVVTYHLWPARLPGGFVGVDMFFAISGFLITAHLMREVVRDGGISLPSFWARRARRLLPASLTVLLATGIAVLVWAPQDLWAQFYREIAASALYVENWTLASDAVDYLAADNLKSPVQHFWSLSAEEQFYIVWPLLIVAALFFAKRATAARRRRTITIVLAVVTVGSFVWSLIQTTTDPSSAYFVTTTRAWEFGAGGLLALVAANPPVGLARLRTTATWIGWALIAAGLVLLTGETPFPGTAALLPVLGVLAILWAGNDGLKFSPTSLTRNRPVQFFGDISYSLYLWHWPLIIMYPIAVGYPASTKVKLVIFVASILLAWASKVWIEDPVRRGVLARKRPWRTFVAVVAGMAIIVGGATTGLGVIAQQAAADEQKAASLIQSGTACFGAAAIDPENQPCVNADLEGTVTPSIATATSDRSDTWGKCAATGTDVKECVLGVPGGIRVALVGDSHTHHWITAIQAIAAKEGWEIHMMVKGSCPFSEINWLRSNMRGASDCVAWNANVNKKLAAEKPYKYLITSMRAESSQEVADTTLSVTDATEAGFAASWEPVIARGTTVVGIRDVPDSDGSVKRCVLNHMDDLSACSRREARDLRFPDYLAKAAAKVPGAVAVDMSDFFCVDGKCPAVIGGVLVHRDDQHITATYAATLGPYLLRKIDAAVKKASNK